MKVSILQENLARGLGIVARAVSTRSTLPVLANVLVATDNGRLKLSATNLEIVITCWIDATVEEEGAITIPARTFSDLVSALPQARVELELSQETQAVHVACGRTEANIKGIDAQEFPLTPEADGADGVRIGAGGFKRMIQQVAFAAATDDTRPILTGVMMAFEGNQLRMAATDAFRLSVRSAEIPAHSQKGTIIVPARTLSEVARVISDDDQIVELLLPEKRKQIIFRLENIVIVSQLINGDFPDFTPIIPTKYTTRTVFSTMALLNASKTADIFARESSHTARLHVEPGDELTPPQAVISATSAETGNNEAVIDANVDGDGISIAFNVKYLTDVLNVIDTPQVALETTTATEPGVIKPVGSEKFTHIIMPMHFGR
ncbi:MAG: DNA polymerase III subunit beta [Anaerolineae bacterium]|nr:DNA polymerase III subunit beta [Anaerolineae bacterium]MCO5190054.1 DNA polymerase III subunit beta [Anaerolineae bacterium]MCO5194514.1 DNA polymerase III subunit beta [Anaerolineae bacterium]MCO5196678.1 DNA polymerase III subunit beta [Anaerolineae bacterium]MCO5206783.1 DNA polymerase III subunit beta [Anaerolineae bacterium]